MTIETMDDLPETPLQDVKPARGRFNNGNVMPMLERFYPAPQIQVMRDHGVDQRMMFGINPYYMALVRGEEYRDAEGKVVLPAMPPSKPLEALVVPILAEAEDMSGEKDPSNQIRYSPDELNPAQYSARSLFGLAYLIVFGSLIGYSAYAWLLANAPIGQVSTYAYVNPVVAIALGAIVLGESITWRIVGGALLVLAAVAIVVRRESRQDVAAEGASFSGAAAAAEADDVGRANGYSGEIAPRRVAKR